MRYEHTQRGRFHLPLLVLGPGLWLVAALGRSAGWHPGACLVLAAVGVVFVLAAASFARLSIREERDHLRLAFGPLPLATRRLPWSRIRSARVARSRVIDGWGIHWVPGRGWTWNLWGFDCVELDLAGGRRLRVGTDDPRGLESCLRRHLDE